jgi:hypothetical protein
MKKILTLALLLSASSAFSQLEIDRNDVYLLKQKNPAMGKADSASSFLNFDLGFHLNSNAVTNDFVKGLLYSGFIDNDRKDLVSKKLKDKNRGGYDFKTGFTFQHSLKKDLALIVGLHERQQFNSKFSRDLFELTFRGNKQFAGETAQLSPLSINYFDYQSLYFGLQKNISSKLIVGGGLAVLRGGRFNTLQIDRGTLYTDPDGEYLDFDLKFKLAFSESENFFSSNGLGAAVNFNVSVLQKKGQFNFEVRDLGMIRWNKLNTYEGDGLFRYDGVDSENILQFSDSVFTRIKADTIAAEFGAVRQEKDFTYWVPATFHANYVYHLADKATMVAGVKYMTSAGYLPRVYVKGIYYLKKDFFIAPMVAYGGFGKLDFELGAAKSFKDKFIISANVFYFEYLVMPKRTAGQGFNVSLTKLF